MSGDLRLLTEAARTAGAIMLDLRASARGRPKADGSPVTDADLAVDRHLRETLTQARPDYGWLSEETPDGPARLSRRRVFVVDPIDGTSAYLGGKPWFAVSLAVVDDGRPVAGVIFAPELGELYAAGAGSGATLDGRAIRVSARDALEGARFAGDPAVVAGPRWPRVEVSRRNALAYRLARVAAGEFDATVSPTPKHEWDIAAGALIAAEAGAAVCDAAGEPLRFNTPRALAPGLVACAPALLALILTRTAVNGRPSRPPPARA